MGLKDYYKEIDDSLRAIENYSYTIHDIDWICNRIDWCWKWRKITEEQKEELCNRAIAILNC